MILGVDGGNFRVKVCGPYGTDEFDSHLGEYRERNMESVWSKDDMIWEYEGEKGFAGKLAEMESETGSSRKGDTKAHKDAKLRILLAIHRNSDDYENKIIVGQPINRHDPKEKEKIISMLKGTHELTINGIKKKFKIKEVRVAAEGATAGLLRTQKGEVKVIDIGSGTVNFATLHNGIYQDLKSWSERFGLETIRAHDKIARKIANLAIDQWHEEDEIFLVGGGADILHKSLVELLPNAKILRPELRENGGYKLLSPTFANAVAFYRVAVKIYES